MSFSLPQLFLFHGAILVVAALLFARALPWNLWLCALVVHMTMPLFILVKGNQSAIYLIDLLAPLLAVFSAWSMQRQNADVAGVTRSFIVLLIGVPLIAGAMAYALGNIDAVSVREGQETLLWFGRNCVFLSVFLFAARLQMDGSRAIALVKLILLLSSVSAALSMLSYFGPLNLAAFEVMSVHNDPLAMAYIEASRVGYGFLGLFRAAVGQWYACVVLLAVASLGVLKSTYRMIAIAAIVLGIGVVLLSFSRAGVVGLAAGLLVLALFGNSRGQKLTAVIAVLVAGLWFWLQSDLVGERVGSIVEATDYASQGRLHIWGLSLKLFANDLGLLLAGTGPASRGRVFELIGGYGAHNEYIDIVYRMGILGPIVLGIVLSLLAQALWKRRQLADPDAKAFCNGMFAVLLANCVMGLTQDHLIHDYSGHAAGVFVYFLYGAALAISTERTGGVAAAAAPLQVWRPPNLMGGRLS